MNITWDHMKVVLALARAKSMTAAAQQLGMDQTTVGRRLTSIETQLGFALFLRSKSGFVATEAGQIVIDNARLMEAQLGEMQDKLHEAQSEAVGLLRLMGNTWMLQRLAEHFLPPILADNPKLEIRLSGRLPPAPYQSEPTVSLWFDAAPTLPDKAIPLCRVPYAAYRLKTAKEGSDWMQFQDDLAQGPSFSRQVRRRLDPEARIRVTATDAQILQGAIRSGLGQGVLPKCIGDQDPELVQVPGEFNAIDRVLHLHISADAYRTKRVQILVQGLFEQISKLLAGQRLLKSPILKL